MNDHTSGLVHYDDIIVLINNVDGDILWFVELLDLIG